MLNKTKNFKYVIIFLALTSLLAMFNNCAPFNQKDFAASGTEQESSDSIGPPPSGGSDDSIDSSPPSPEVEQPSPPAPSTPPPMTPPPMSQCPLPKNPMDVSQCPLPPRQAPGTNGDFKAFEKAWWHLKERYAYFKERKTDWNCEYERAVQMMGKTPSKNQMTQALKDLLKRLQDGHVSFKGDSYVDYGRSNPYRHKKKIQDVYLASGGNCPSKKLCHGSLKKNSDIGYIRLDLMEGAVSPSKIANALETLQSKKALIVDLRFNDGGFDSTALALMGHFTSSSVVSHYKEDKRAEGFVNKRNINIKPRQPFLNIPVYVLSSPVTASAAEIGVIAANSLADQPGSKVTTIGGRSEGITSDIVTYKGSGLTIDYSGERYSSPEPHCLIFERIGVNVMHDAGYAEVETLLKDRLTAFDKYLDQGLKNNMDPDIEKALALFSQ